MYRDDQEALHQRAEDATREAARLEGENAAMRQAVSRMQLTQPAWTLALPANAVYTMVDLRTLPVEERGRLANHSVKPFPVWLIGILNVLTFGLFPMIHFGLLHDRLPRASHNDPSSGKAIGFQFIPYYNLYWIFFNALRLCDRLTLQFRLRLIPDRAPKGLIIAACVLTVLPYVNIVIGIPILWTIAVCVLQSKVNRVAALSPAAWDATELQPPLATGTMPPPIAGMPAGYPMFQASPEQLAVQARARNLVNWSHLLGWGGLVVLVVGGGTATALGGPVAGGTVATISIVGVIVGAVIGQIGRGMQGRAI